MRHPALAQLPSRNPAGTNEIIQRLGREKDEEGEGSRECTGRVDHGNAAEEPREWGKFPSFLMLSTTVRADPSNISSRNLGDRTHGCVHEQALEPAVTSARTGEKSTDNHERRKCPAFNLAASGDTLRVVCEDLRRLRKFCSWKIRSQSPRRMDRRANGKK
jgi:hypothetical protein